MRIIKWCQTQVPGPLTCVVVPEFAANRPHTSVLIFFYFGRGYFDKTSESQRPPLRSS